MRAFAMTAALVLSVMLASAWDLGFQELECRHTHTNVSGPSSSSCDIETALVPELSDSANVVLPGKHKLFETLEIRASSPRIKPLFTAIVEPTTEGDVQTIVGFREIQVEIETRLTTS